LRSRIIEYLEGTTVEDLAKALDQKRRALDRGQRKGRKVAAEKAVAVASRK
jgi:hypothetical protein